MCHAPVNELERRVGRSRKDTYSGYKIVVPFTLRRLLCSGPVIISDVDLVVGMRLALLALFGWWRHDRGGAGRSIHRHRVALQAAAVRRDSVAHGNRTHAARFECRGREAVARLRRGIVILALSRGRHLGECASVHRLVARRRDTLRACSTLHGHRRRKATELLGARGSEGPSPRTGQKGSRHAAITVGERARSLQARCVRCCTSSRFVLNHIYSRYEQLEHARMS